MTRPEVTDDGKIVETWEAVVPGAVIVWIYDRREDKYVKQSVGGRGSRRLQITRDDRKYNQELIPVENTHHDPFTNGALRLIKAATRDETLDERYHMSADDIASMFEIRDLDNFIEAISGIESELILRRIADMSETIGTNPQSEAVRELIRTRYPVGGTQRTVQEMLDAGERLGVARI